MDGNGHSSIVPVVEQLALSMGMADVPSEPSVDGAGLVITLKACMSHPFLQSDPESTHCAQRSGVGGNLVMFVSKIF